MVRVAQSVSGVGTEEKENQHLERILETHVDGAESAAWEALLEMESYDLKAGQEDKGAVSLVVDMAIAFEKVQLVVIQEWAMNVGFPQRVLSILCGDFAQVRRERFENNVSDPLQTITAISLGSKWSVLLLMIAMQEAKTGKSLLMPSIKNKSIRG